MSLCDIPKPCKLGRMCLVACPGCEHESFDDFLDRINQEEHARATDPFGDAVRDAQVHPGQEPTLTYRPDNFMAPGFDREAAYRRVMGAGA